MSNISAQYSINVSPKFTERNFCRQVLNIQSWTLLNKVVERVCFKLKWKITCILVICTFEWDEFGELQATLSFLDNTFAALGLEQPNNRKLQRNQINT